MTPFRAPLALLAALVSLNAAAQLSTSLTTPASGVPTGGTIPFLGGGAEHAQCAAHVRVHLLGRRGADRFLRRSGLHVHRPLPVQCVARNVPAGASIPFRFTAQATNDEAAVGQVLSASVTASTVIPDDQPVFSSTHVNVPVTRSPAEADLAVTLDAGPSDAQPSRSTRSSARSR